MESRKLMCPKCFFEAECVNRNNYDELLNATDYCSEVEGEGCEGRTKFCSGRLGAAMRQVRKLAAKEGRTLPPWLRKEK